MNEIAGLCTRDRFSSLAPADFADAGKDVGDRLLLAVMVNPGLRSRLDLEQASPESRTDTECGGDSRAAFGTRRLRSSALELLGTDDVDCREIHDIPDQFEIVAMNVRGRTSERD